MTGGGRFYGWGMLAVASLILFFVNGVYLYSFGTFLPSIRNEFGRGTGDISLAMGILMIVCNLVAPLAGFFIGRFGVRMAVVVGNIFGVAALIALSFHTMLWQFNVSYGVMGLAAGFSGILTTSTICSNWFRKRVPLALGIVVTAGGVGGMVLAPLIMNTILNSGWRTTYRYLGILMAVVAVVGIVLIRNKPEDLGQLPDGIEPAANDEDVSHSPAGSSEMTMVDFTLGETLKTPTFWLITFYGSTTIYLTSMITAHQVAFLTSLGVGAEVSAMTLGIISLMSAVGTLAFGLVSIKFRLKKIAVAVALVTVVSLVFALLTTNTVLAFLYSIFFGLGFGSGMAVVISMLTTYYGRAHFSRIVGINMLAGIVGTIGAPVAGFVFDVTGTYRIPFVIALVVASLGFVCMAVLKPPVHASLRIERT